jgi:pseudouridine kinase
MRFSRVLCIGGCVVDRLGQTLEAPARLHTSNIGRMSTGFGGAGRNVAENLARLGVPVMLATRVGADDDGVRALAHLRAVGVDTRLVDTVPSGRTATYTALFDAQGALVIGLADMEVHGAITPAIALASIEAAGPDAFIFVDANLDAATLAAIAGARPRLLAAGPVSQQKALRLQPLLPAIDWLFLNRYEASAMTGIAASDLEALAQGMMRAGARAGVLTADRDGMLLFVDGTIRTYPAPAADIVNVNGAGDAAAAGVISGLVDGMSAGDAIERGLAAAALTVESVHSVRPDLSPELLRHRMRSLNP